MTFALALTLLALRRDAAISCNPYPIWVCVAWGSSRVSVTYRCMPPGGRGGTVGGQHVRSSQFRHRVGTHLDLEAHQALGRLSDRSCHGPRAVLLGCFPGDMFQNGLQVGTGSHRRVNCEDVWVAEPFRLAQSGD